MSKDYDGKEKLPKETIENEESSSKNRQDSPKHISNHDKHKESSNDKQVAFVSSQDSQISHPQDAQSNRQDSLEDPEGNLVPKIKKYHHYPVTCNYCTEKFQPDEIKSHIETYHEEGPRKMQRPSRVTSSGTQEENIPEIEDSTKTISVEKVPSPLQTCYVCGQLYGSKSLGIHEPKCLKKWKVQNDQLPPDKREPQPTRSKPRLVDKGAKQDEEGQTLSPEAAPDNRVAFKEHLKTLIPCKYCSRTFSPDRVIIHQNCCTSRPASKTRQLATPPDGEIKR